MSSDETPPVAPSPPPSATTDEAAPTEPLRSNSIASVAEAAAADPEKLAVAANYGSGNNSGFVLGKLGNGLLSLLSIGT